jgi:hypothetical protein
VQAPPRPRPRVISAGHTWFLKWGLPGFFLLEWLWWVVQWARMRRLHVPIPPALALYIFGSAALCLWVGWSFLRLKRVAYTETDLHLSNFRREIVVPLADVASVGRTIVGMNALVIQLVRDTEFGSRITFIPKRMFHPFVWTHPMVDRLRDAVAAAKAKTETKTKPKAAKAGATTRGVL